MSIRRRVLVTCLVHSTLDSLVVFTVDSVVVFTPAVASRMEYGGIREGGAVQNKNGRCFGC